MNECYAGAEADTSIGNKLNGLRRECAGRGGSGGGGGRARQILARSAFCHFVYDEMCATEGAMGGMAHAFARTSLRCMQR